MISLKYYILERKRLFLFIGSLILLIGLILSYLIFTKKTVTVSDGTQSVSVTVYGFSTVSDAISKSGLTLDPYDQLNCSLDSFLKADDTVLISQDTLTATPELLAEQQEQAQIESARAEAEAYAALAAQPNTVVTSSGIFYFSKKLTVVATAYDPSSCYPYAGTTTASGTSPQEFRTIAAWKGLPFGTKVYIPYFDSAPNHGIFIVEDRGGAITEDRIDIFYDTNQEALQFGRKTLEMYILE